MILSISLIKRYHYKITLNLKMIKIFGKNNNQLFRHSHKTTFSMPQSLPFSQPILKCACGFDYIAIVTQAGQLYFLFQSKFYPVFNIPFLWDIATAENTIAMLTKDRQIFVWDFDENKILNNNINPTKIRIELDHDDYIKQIEMGSGDVFLISQLGKVYHFKRNQWYQTKSYSNIESVQLSQSIIQVSSGSSSNLFLTYQGLLFKSTKQNPLYLTYVETPHKFIKIASSTYNAGITKKGTLMIWGNSIHGNYKEPTEFSKLTKKFIDIKLQNQNGYALSDDGEVWVWGVNQNGQLGLSDYQSRIKPFPLITLEKSFVLDFFCGPSYACCLCSPDEKMEKKSLNIIDRKTTAFHSVRQQMKLTKNEKAKKEPIFISEQNYQIKQRANDSPLQIRMKNQQKSIHKKSQHKKSNSGSCSPSPMNKSKVKKNEKNERKSETKGKQKLTGHQKRSSWIISEKQNEEDIFSLQNTNRNLELELVEVKEQNLRLKQKVSEQEDIINDITDKIRMLQEAIDQHERNLTSRDHVVHEYQMKQKEYISHIDQLQKTIDEIVRFKEKNNEVMVIYEDLKINFEKQRGYYIEKIKDYEIKLSQQDQKYKNEIQNLYRKLAAKQTKNKQNKPIASWESHSPITKKYEVPYFRGQFGQGGQRNLNSSSMEQVIDQIESNKSRITKSANKLIAMLDISQ